MARERNLLEEHRAQLRRQKAKEKEEKEEESSEEDEEDNAKGWTCFKLTFKSF